MMKYWLDTNQMTEAEMIAADGLPSDRQELSLPWDRRRARRRRRINRSTTAGVVVADHQYYRRVDQTRMIFPGFKRLSGSSACLIARITLTASPCSAIRKSIFP